MKELLDPVAGSFGELAGQGAELEELFSVAEPQGALDSSFLEHLQACFVFDLGRDIEARLNCGLHIEDVLWIVVSEFS